MYTNLWYTRAPKSRRRGHFKSSQQTDIRSGDPNSLRFHRYRKPARYSGPRRADLAGWAVRLLQGVSPVHLAFAAAPFPGLPLSSARILGAHVFFPRRFLFRNTHTQKSERPVSRAPDFARQNPPRRPRLASAAAACRCSDRFPCERVYLPVKWEARHSLSQHIRLTHSTSSTV